MNTMILAAGLGTRLRPLTFKVPKPAVPFLNVPILNFSRHLLSEISPRKIVINTHHLPDEVKKVAMSLAYQDRERVETVFSHEPRILGSGGGIWQARDHLRETQNFIVVNGDNVILPRHKDFLARAVQFHEQHQPLATLFAIRHPLAGIDFNALWASRDGRLKDISKTSPGPNFEGFHFIGVQIYSDRIFDFMPSGESNIFRDTLLPAMAKGEPVMVYEADCEWYETGDPESYVESTRNAIRFLGRDLRSSYQRQFLGTLFEKYVSDFEWARSFTVDPGGALILVGSDARIGSRVQFHSFAVVGSRAQIGDDSLIRSSIILPDSQVAPKTECFEQLIY